MKSELVIFGRSPFINQVDVPLLLENYTTVGFNQFGKHHKVDHLFFFDDYYYGYKPTAVYLPKWFSQKHGIKYVPKPSDRPILSRQMKDNMIVLGHKYFTVSLALNWALLEGFKTIYLVGIDHVETDNQFKHHDGVDLPANLTPKAHKDLKKYVYACAEHADIYQCNPAVAPDWELKYKDIRELYV